MAVIFPHWPMMRVVIITVALVGGMILLHQVLTGGKAVQTPVSPSSAYLLSDQELQQFKNLASKGDCEAAFKVNRYYSDVLNDFGQALPWLRLAAHCPNANAKAELVYLLLTPVGKGDSAGEIDQLVLELEKIDPSQAHAVKKEVETRRAAKEGLHKAPQFVRRMN